MNTTGDNDVDLDAYRNYMLARGLSSNTIGQRAVFARARWEEWGRWPTSGATIAAWLDRHQGWTKWTYHGHLKSLYGWLVADGLVAENPLLLIRRPPRPRPRPRPLTEAELRRALETAPSDVGDWLMLGYLAGLRSHEIAKFRGEEIDEHGVYILGKGGQSWMIPTHPLLWQLAQSHPRVGYWFPSPLSARVGQPVSPITVTNKISRHFRSLGIAGATHRARHTYATQLLRDGANLRVVQELLRHASLSTTALYLGIDEEEKREAIRRLSWAA